MSYLNNPVIFNGNYLEQVPGLTVLAYDPYRTAKRGLAVSEIANSNKSIHNSAYYNNRTITVKVGIARATRPILETSIDTLMTMLQGINKSLILPQSGATRQYFCTFVDAPVDKNGASYIELDLTFECADKFGYDVTPTTLLSISTPYSSQSRSDRLQFFGSAPTQTPVIRLTYSAVSGASNKAVTIGNGQTGQQIVISRIWLAGDFIEIDTLNKTVRVNNIDVDFTGAIPEWGSGYGYWSYFDTFTSRTFTGDIIYYKRYSS